MDLLTGRGEKNTCSNVLDFNLYLPLSRVVNFRILMSYMGVKGWTSFLRICKCVFITKLSGSRTKRWGEGYKFRCLNNFGLLRRSV